MQYRFQDAIDQQTQKIEILELSEERCKFVLYEIDISYANALRRVMIAEVPVMAIHFVDIIENTSPLQDEFLSQRLGLIPLISSKADEMLYDWEVDYDNMNELKYKVTFSLKAKNNNDIPLEVTSLDLVPDFEDISAGAVKPVRFFSPIDGREVGIPITKLGKNQSIHVRCHALKGFGKMHAKWSPVNIATFRHEPEIIIDNTQQLSQSEKEEIVKSCPTQVLALEKGEIKVKFIDQCVFCEECQRKAESFKKPRMIKIQHKKNKFIFHVEGTGQLRASDIVTRAFQVIGKKLSDINDCIEQSRRI